MKNLKNKMWMRRKKAFTLVEIITAVGMLVMVVGFTSIIFKTSIEGYRTSVANGEIMQKLQTITTQLNRDFQGLPKDGFLRIVSKTLNNQPESKYSNLKKDAFMDSIYYFTAGDYQSWFNPNYRSNIARIYFGLDSSSLSGALPLDRCKLVRDTLLLTPAFDVLDTDKISYSKIRTAADPFTGYTVPDSTVFVSDPNASLDNVRSRMCEGVGGLKIEWFKDLVIDGVTKKIQWGRAGQWTPDSLDWPEALKFTFTLYDSKGILRGGRTFTHIVYLGN